MQRFVCMEKNVWLPKCNEMDRMYCFAYDIVDTTEKSGIEPEKQKQKHKWTNQLDFTF